MPLPEDLNSNGSMKIIVAPDSFKESLSAQAACEAIARGVRSVRPDADIDCIPIAEGGEGTVESLVNATGGSFRESPVAGPLGERVLARWGLLGHDGGAVVEMAAASGLALVPQPRRNPIHTTTYGTGELMREAMDAQAPRILVGLGGSATTDGGAGAAQAAGVSFFSRSGAKITRPLTGQALAQIARIDMSTRDPRFARSAVQVACDVDNPLCGPRGSAAIYGPQKGASPRDVQTLDRNLAHLADIIDRDVGKNVRDFPGAGAAGGFGAGLVAFFDAEIRQGVRLVMDAVRFDERISGADLILTGEGRLDAQSMMGKVIEGVGRAGQAAGVPVVALVGSAGEGADNALKVLHSFHVITPGHMQGPAAFGHAAGFLEQAAARVLSSFA
jgi:glycerate kinase